MNKLCRLLAVIGFATSFLAGCAGTTEPDGGSTGNMEVAPPAQEAEISNEADEEPVEWPRTYVDALGREVELTGKPERVALLFFRNFEHLFLLGESPVAAADLDVLDEWASLAPYKDADIEDLGSIAAPNLEKLLQLEPDLIIAVEGRFESYGEQLERIASVVTVESNENNWQGALREYGKIFGEEQKAEDEIARIEALITSSRQQLEAFADKTFAVIMLGDKSFWAFTTQFVFDAENGLGLQPPDHYADMSTKGEEITLEGLAAMNPDYMFVADIGGSSRQLQGYLNDLEHDPVWNSLDAVKNGRMFALDSSIAAGGPLGIELGVNTIMENVVGSP